jgi:ATPase family associated with various cellular activities (AAA)
MLALDDASPAAAADVCEDADVGARHRHAADLDRELAWLGEAIEVRLTRFFAGEGDGTLPPPPALGAGSAYGRLVAAEGLDRDARLVLALALAPHVRPALLDPFFVRNSALDRLFTEFGARQGAQAAGFQPTGETALFLVAGSDVPARAEAARLFAADHPLRVRVQLTLDAVPGGGPAMAGALTIPRDQAAFLLAGESAGPDYASDFPARRLATPMTWDDLVLAPEVLDQVDHVAAWIAGEGRILDDWGLRRVLTPGYRALFYGPPGTGKTLTAALLGQRAGLEVYRIDLSMVVSKYIGETEKNLAGVFDRAAHGRWILFFDEADALFGTRTSTTSSNDRYANQEVAYLLQRIEDCPCVVILATNLRGNIDDAFSRRFQSMIGFTRPDPEQRARLWRGALAPVPLRDDVRVEDLAREHDLVGGSIVNAVRHAAVCALRKGSDAIAQADLLAGIAVEARKEGRTP